VASLIVNSFQAQSTRRGRTTSIYMRAARRGRSDTDGVALKSTLDLGQSNVNEIVRHSLQNLRRPGGDLRFADRDTGRCTVRAGGAA
jgi:hypothetical protein